MRLRVVSASAFFVALALALPVQAAAGTPVPRLLFGAYSPDAPDRGRSDTLAKLEGATGRPLNILHWYQPWGSRDWVTTVQREMLDAVAGSGRTPLITWEPWDPRLATPHQPAFSLARIGSGVRVLQRGRKRWRVTGCDARSGKLVSAARSGSAVR